MSSPFDSETNHHPLDDRFEHLTIGILRDAPHVTVVALHRPRKRNAMNGKLWREIGEAFRLLGTRGDGCRCVLLVGSGKAFSAGIDVTDPTFFPSSQEEEIDPARRGMAFHPQIREMQQCFTYVDECRVPVVAAIHGSCIGAGVDLACCADVRLCSSSSLFSVREARLGLAADVGTLQRLPRIVGHGSRVRELCFTGEDFDAEEAARIGFVSRVAVTDQELWQMAKGICTVIASNSPLAVAGTKLSLNYSRDHSVADGLAHVAAHNALALQTDDLVTTFASGLKGEKPTYSDLLPHSRL